MERRGLDRYAALLSADFADGVTARPVRVIPGASLTVSELLLDSPPDQPLHCPPAATFLHFHDGRTTRRITTHYATRA